MKMFRSLGLLVISLLLSKTLGLAPTDQIQDGDISQSGYVSNKGISLPLIQDPTFGVLWTTNSKEGSKEQFLAKPLVYTPTSTGRQVVIAASEMNWVYIMDAFNGTILASKQLGRPFLVTDLNGCNDIAGYIGVTGTPIIDPSTDTIYLFSKSYKDMTPGGATGYLNGMYRVWALSAIDLSTRPGFPVILDGHPADNDLGKYFHGGTHLQRPSAHLQNGVVYAGFAGHCDQFNYTGWVAGIDITTGAVKTMFSTESGHAAPPQDGTWNGGGGGAGIWMGGFGFSSDNANRFFFVTGNGYGHENGQFPVSGKTPPGTLEESVVNMAIDPATGKVKPQDFFQPYEYLSLDAADKDFGSGGIALLDPATFNGANAQRIGATVGKNAKMYLVNMDNLGGYKMGSGGGDKIVQAINMPGGSAVFAGVGSYPGEGGYLYVAPVGYNVLVYKFGHDVNGNGVFTQVAMTDETSAGRVGVGVPTITSLDGSAGTAILWLTDPDNGLRAWKAVPENGKMIRIPLPPTGYVHKFQRPVFGNKKIYLSTSNGQIICLGSPVALPLTCTSPLDFGNVLLGTVQTLQVNCTCNIPVTSLAGVVVQNTKYFSASNSSLPAGPCAKGGSFSFPVYMNLTDTVIADMPNTTVPGVIPGPVSGAVNIITKNGVTGYSSSQPIALTGVLVSNAAILAVTPSEVSFGGVVINSSDAINGITNSMFINNLGKQPLQLTGYAYTLDELADPNPTWVDVQQSANDSSVWILNDGFTAKLPVLGTVLPGGASIAVELRFSPSAIGDFSVILGLKSNVTGNAYKIILLAGVAATAPSGVLETKVGNGTYTNSTIVEFGNIPGGTNIQAVIRITNTGGSALTVTKSKPPEGAELGAVNPSTDLHEGIHILPNTSSLGFVAFEPIVSTILNQLPRDISGQWTLNTDGLGFGGPYEVKFHGTAVTPQVGPTFANGSSIYRYLGCYKDSTAQRIEPNNFVNQTANENGLCQNTCKKNNWVFAGTEYNWECWCGNFIPDDSLKVDNSLCQLQCSGDSTQVCGGFSGYASFYYDVTRYDPVTKAFDGVVGKGIPHIVQSVGNFTYQGCYSEATSGRALTAKSINSVNVNVTMCAAFCNAYTYFGVEYGRECYCGNTLAATSVKKPDTDCNMFCIADEFSYCGAGGRLGLYQKGGNSNSTLPSSSTTVVLVSSSTTVIPVSSSTTPAVSSTLTTTAPPTAFTGTANYTYIACWSDTDLGNRTLQGKTQQDQTGNNPDSCHTFCSGYQYFGMEYGYECWCGDVVRPGSEQRPETECTMPCPGGATMLCGDSFRLNLYHNVPPTASNATTTTTVIATTTPPTNTTTTTVIATTTPPPTPPTNTTTTTVVVTTTAPNTTTTTTTTTTTDTTTTTTTTPVTGPTGTANYTYIACWSDTDLGNRTLQGKTQQDQTGNSPDSCHTFCAGFEYFGLEYGYECWCGNVVRPGSEQRPETECNMPCSGDANKLCGAGYRLNLYHNIPPAPNNTTTTTVIATTTAPVNITTIVAVVSTTDSVVNTTTAVVTTTTTSVVVTNTTSTAPVTTSVVVTNTASTALVTTSVVATNTTSTAPVTTSVVVTNTASTALVTTSVVATNTTSTASITTTSTTAAPSATSISTYLGCWTDAVANRTLRAKTYRNANVTIEYCENACLPYGAYYGVEYSDECYCGNVLQGPTTKRNETECNMKCAGNANETCGGSNRLNLYIYNRNLTTTTTTTTTITTTTTTLPGTDVVISTTAPAVVTTTTTTPLVTPTSTTPVGDANFDYYGCYTDKVGARALANWGIPASADMTIQKCLTGCSQYTYAGLEYGKECWCGNTLNSTSLLRPDSECNMACSGDATEKCGAGSRLSLFRKKAVLSSGNSTTA